MNGLRGIFSCGSCGVWGSEYERCPLSLSLPTFATAQFKRFFDWQGGQVHTACCLWPVPASGGSVWFSVVYQGAGADTDAEQLALTEQFFDAALG